MDTEDATSQSSSLSSLADFSQHKVIGDGVPTTTHSQLLVQDLMQWLAKFPLKNNSNAIYALPALIGLFKVAVSNCWNFLTSAHSWISFLFTIQVIIPPWDELNREVQEWIEAKVLLPQNARVLQASTDNPETKHLQHRRNVSGRDTKGTDISPIKYSPSWDKTWFFFGRHIMLVRVKSDKTDAAHESFILSSRGMLDIKCFGFSVNTMDCFLKACREHSKKKKDKCILVRSWRETSSHAVYWNRTFRRPTRALETLDLDTPTLQDLLQDIDRYFDQHDRAFYEKRGIPHRKGYLFHGPPGTGKSSLVSALAAEYKLDLYLIQIPKIRNDSTLEELFAIVPSRSIILLEDIDTVGLQSRFHSGQETNAEVDELEDDSLAFQANNVKSFGSGCTLNGLLNVLDGVASQDHRIVIMTSNYIDRLDPALIRSGRIHKKIKFDHLSEKSTISMFLRIFSPTSSSAKLDAKDESPSNANALSEKSEWLAKKTEQVKLDRNINDLAKKCAAGVPPGTVTPAQLQDYLIEHRDDPESAVEGIKDMVARVREERTKQDKQIEWEKTRAVTRRKRLARDHMQSGAMDMLKTVAAMLTAAGASGTIIGAATSPQLPGDTSVAAGSNTVSFGKNVTMTEGTGTEEKRLPTP